MTSPTQYPLGVFLVGVNFFGELLRLAGRADVAQAGRGDDRGHAGDDGRGDGRHVHSAREGCLRGAHQLLAQDRKSTRLNSSHVSISYSVFCLQKNTAKRAIDHTSIARTPYILEPTLTC